jgi:aryl-alcohol dehydrogenase-like predicted oxidoreductase
VTAADPLADRVGSALVLGTMTFGAQVDAAAAREMVDRCLAAGVVAIDTANVYAGGASERIVGQVIRGRRDDVVLATKVGLPTDEAEGDPPLSPSAIRRCLEHSLRRLGTDHVDLYYLHAPDRRTPIADTLATMDELVRAGKVRRVGTSNYAAWQLADIDACAATHGLVRPTVSQILYNLLGRRVEDEYVEFAATHDIANVAYNPLAGGLLTGKHAANDVPGDGRFGASALGPQYRQRYWHDATFAAVEVLAGIAAGAGLTLVELAYRWLRSRPGADATVLGASSVGQLTANLAAATGPDLPPDVLSACDDVWSRLRGPAPDYNR